MSNLAFLSGPTAVTCDTSVNSPIKNGLFVPRGRNMYLECTSQEFYE